MGYFTKDLLNRVTSITRGISARGVTKAPEGVDAWWPTDEEFEEARKRRDRNRKPAALEINDILG